MGIGSRMRRGPRRSGSALATAVAVGLAACGATNGAGPSPAPDPAGGSTTDTGSPTATGTPTDTPAPIRWQKPVRLTGDLGYRRPAIAAGTDGLVALAPTSTEEPPRTRVHTSADALTWDEQETLDGIRLHAVTAGGTGFVAVGARDTGSGATTPVAATSQDGRSWSVDDVDASNPGEAKDVTAAGERLVAVGYTLDEDGDRRPATWTSPDGRAWTAGSPPPTDDTSHVLWDVATVGSAVTTVGQGWSPESDSPQPMSAWVSGDGRSWEPAPAGGSWESVLLGDLSDGPAGAVLVGTSTAANDPTAWHSADGRGWDAGTALPLLPDTDSSFAEDVASGDGRYVAVGDAVDFAEDLGPASSRPAVWVSTDAATWSLVPPADLEGPALEAGSNAFAVLHGDGRWLVFGTTSEMADAPISWVLWVGE